MFNKKEENITRITIDIDNRDINQMIKCLKTLKKYYFDKELTIKQSPSGRGYHIISWSDKGVTLKKLLKIRGKSGDDKIRIKLDGKTGRQIQVLFTEKKKTILKKTKRREIKNAEI
jgi:hypothetical protein